MSDKKKPLEFTIEELGRIPVNPVSIPEPSWRERALQVVEMYRYGMAMRINVPNEDQRSVLTEFYRDNVTDKGLEFCEIDCATATEDDFLGQSNYDPSTNSVVRDYPAYWTDKGTVVLVTNVDKIRPNSVPGIRQVCCLENERDRKKNWVMLMILTPADQELGFRLLEDSGVINLEVDGQA